MDCALILPDLIAYDFGTLDESRRDAVDAHLLACNGCLRTYLRLRRQLTSAPDARPSEAVRLQLRAQVQATFPGQSRPRTRTWWRRPIPLYQGAAAAAVLALLVGLAMGLTGLGYRGAAQILPRGGATETAHVDTSRRVPETVAIY